jgi:hypothetical protein
MRSQVVAEWASALYSCVVKTPKGNLATLNGNPNVDTRFIAVLDTSSSLTRALPKLNSELGVEVFKQYRYSTGKSGGYIKWRQVWVAHKSAFEYAKSLGVKALESYTVV